MSTTVSLLLCIFLAMSYLQECAAVPISNLDSWTLVDNEEDEVVVDEPDMSGWGSGSGFEGVHTLGWVQHARMGDVYVSKEPDIKNLVDFIALHSALDDGTADFASLPPQEMEDGPELKINFKKYGKAKSKDKRSSDPNSVYECVEEISSINYYPEYAIGLLDNGCTAFLVGPHHAMTSARCVYKQDQRLWEEDLDFWRGRHDLHYLQRMEWESVVIPQEFFEHGDQMYNWAIITFEKKSVSKVWLNFVYSPKPVIAYATKYGYNGSTDGIMVSKICEGVKEKDNVKLLHLDCCESNETMNGGPVLKGYNFNHSKMPKVCGINHRDKFGEESSVGFNSDTFWSVCYLLDTNGFDADCGKV